MAGAVAGAVVFDSLDSSLDPAASSEAEVAEAFIRETSGAEGSVVVIVDAGPDSPELGAAATRLARIEGVVSVDSPSDGTGALVSSDGETSLLVVGIAAGLSDDSIDSLLGAIGDALSEFPDDDVRLAGSAVLDAELGGTAEADLLRADAVAIPVVLVMLMVILGGLWASTLPLSIIVVAVSVPMGLLWSLSTFTTVSVFAVNVITMFGVGLAVDYSLLIVSRFREERLSRGVDEAVTTTMATAGRAVAYSGITVAVSLSGLLVFREPILRSLAYGGVGAVLVAVAASRTLLPVLLRKMGHRIKPKAESATANGAISRITAQVQRRPALVMGVVVGILFAMSIPLFRISFQGLDARSLPSHSPTRQAIEELEERFTGVQVGPIVVLADATAEDPRLAEFTEHARALDGVESSRVLPLSAEASVIEIGVTGAATDRRALELVSEVRAIDSELRFQIAGEAAEEVDLLASIADRLPWALLWIGLSTMVMLALFTRSIFAAAKALLVNILSVAASFGVLVWVFQDGNLSRWLGFEAIGGLEAIVLLLTFVFGFGLSMDYEVFLIGRIRETYDAGGDNTRAVAEGLRRSGRVVTQAALLIVIVFVGFSSGDLLLIKQLGVGLAIAVLVDATIVRLLLVPAIMTLAGDWNWWFPQKLGRLVDP